MPKTAPTYAEFIVAFPAFADSDQPTVERQLSLSTRLLEAKAWGDFYSDAVGLDTAHNLSLALKSDASLQGTGEVASGPVNSVSAAGVSVSFSTSSPEGQNNSRNWYLKTGYGQQFLRLRDAVIPPMVLSV